MQFNIISAGDFMAGENAHHYRRGIPSKYRNNFRNLISDEVREVLSNGDLLFLNFESSLADERLLRKLPIEKAVYAAPLETLSLLQTLDIPIIANIANNHFAQHGQKRANFTVEQLEKAGIIVIGKDNKPVTIAKNGSIIKIWGVSLVKDQIGSESYYKSTYDKLLEEIRLSEKEENEIRIISIHWGDEYNTLPNVKQKKLANSLIENEFDLILGHHPHTIQSIEKINKSWVVYSHGNLLFDQNFSSLTQKGLITRFSFPDNNIELFLTQQKHFSVASVKRIQADELNKLCEAYHSDYNPFKMRLRMKTELLRHFYQSNLPTFKMFAGRLLSK